MTTTAAAHWGAIVWAYSWFLAVTLLVYSGLRLFLSLSRIGNVAGNFLFFALCIAAPFLLGGERLLFVHRFPFTLPAYGVGLLAALVAVQVENRRLMKAIRHAEEAARHDPDACLATPADPSGVPDEFRTEPTR